MGNLKKVLSMVLAVMMVMALMTTAFAAEAKALDYSDSQFQDEAMLLNELGIIVGGDSGSWDAERLVTRGEFCKMICVAMNGGVDNPALYTGDNTTGLTDIDGHWAKGYIIYCFKLGIISGWDNIFSPNTSVTGVQGAKILLTALGYDAVKEGYVNVSDWELNINVKSGEVGLYEGLGATYDPRQPLSRDYAAKMIANAFDAFMVYYDQNINIQLEALTFGQKRLRLRTLEGLLAANEYASVQAMPDSNPVGYASPGESIILINDTSTNNVWATAPVPITSDIDDLGKMVKVYVRYKTAFPLLGNNGQLAAYTIDAVEKVFGKVAPSAKNVVYSTGKGFTQGNLGDYLTDNKIRFTTGTRAVGTTDGTQIQVNYGTPVASAAAGATLIPNFFGAVTPANGGVFTRNGVNTNDDVLFKGENVRFVDYNNDRIIDYIFVIQDTFATISDYDTTRDRVTFDIDSLSQPPIDFVDIIGIEDFNLDDKVFYYEIADTGTYMISLADSFTGSLASYTTAAGGNYVAVISGKNYQFANNTGGGLGNNQTYPSLENGKTATWNVAGNNPLDLAGNYGTELTYWIDRSGYIVDFKGADASNDYCVIKESAGRAYQGLGGQPSQALVSVLTGDGTNYNGYTVSSLQNVVGGPVLRWDGTRPNADSTSIANALGGVNGNNFAEGRVFAYVVNTDSKTIDLRLPNGSTSQNYGASNGPGYNKGTSITVNALPFIVTNESAFFIKNQGLDAGRQWIVYKGNSAVPTLSSPADYNGTNGSAAVAAWTSYVANSGRPNGSRVVGGISIQINSATIVGDAGRYAIILTDPVFYNTAGGTRYVTFQGVYKGEVREYKTANDIPSIQGLQGARGRAIIFNGSEDNIQSYEWFDTNRFSGLITDVTGNTYTLSSSPVTSTIVGTKGGSTFYTNVDGASISSATGFGRSPQPYEWGKTAAVAVTHATEGYVIDFVRFNPAYGAAASNSPTFTAQANRDVTLANAGNTATLTFTFTSNNAVDPSTVDTAGLPGNTTQFALAVAAGGGGTANISSIAVNGNVVTVTVTITNASIAAGDTLTVTYNPAGGAEIDDAYGNAIPIPATPASTVTVIANPQNTGATLTTASTIGGKAIASLGTPTTDITGWGVTSGTITLSIAQATTASIVGDFAVGSTNANVTYFYDALGTTGISGATSWTAIATPIASIADNSAIWIRVISEDGSSARNFYRIAVNAPAAATTFAGATTNETAANANNPAVGVVFTYTLNGTIDIDASTVLPAAFVIVDGNQSGKGSAETLTPTVSVNGRVITVTVVGTALAASDQITCTYTAVNGAISDVNGNDVSAVGAVATPVVNTIQ